MAQQIEGGSSDLTASVRRFDSVCPAGWLRTCLWDGVGAGRVGQPIPAEQRGDRRSLAAGETVIRLHPPSPFSRCFNRDGEGV